MEMVPKGITSAIFMRFVDLATDALASTREEIDALNVFPVPDGDTGTNMFLTVSAARDSAREALADLAETTDIDLDSPEALGAVLAAFARGALLGARGNSGVILSQILGALADRLAEAGAEVVAAFATAQGGVTILAEAMSAAADAAYRAVGTPVEGTILSVARAAADAAGRFAAQGGARTAQVFAVAAEAAREALARTPEQLAILRDAGVVDAGGRGLSVILDAAERAATGRTMVSGTTAPTFAPRPPMLPEHASDPGTGLTAEGPSYEVMYLLDADEEAIEPLRTRLGALGDSLVVVGSERLWNVHVHVDDVGAAVEAGIEAGRPHRIRVTHFADQMAGVTQPSARIGRAVVAVAAGPGLGTLFASSGAVVVTGGAATRPSTGQLLEAITGCGAAEVVVLPNDSDSVRVAQIAASTAEKDSGLRVVVIPTQAQVQGLAAMAVHDPGRSFDTDVLEMTATAAHARHGAVTIAAKQAITMAGPCEPGDVLGVIAGDFAVVGYDVLAVVCEVLGRLLAGGGELVTLVAGEGAPSGVADRTVAWLEETHPHVDVEVFEGGQDRYPFLMSVE